MTILSANEFYTQMRDYFIANQDKITDLNTDSSIDTQFRAFANQLNQAMVKASGGFKSQFEQIPFQIFDFQRKSATTSSGTLVFSVSTAATTDLTIPLGTIVATTAGLLYETTAAGVILTGNTSSSPITAQAQSSGSDYNTLINTVTVINSSLPEVNSVTNNTAFTGGTDKETNSEYFARFSNFILGLSGANRYGVFTAAVTVDDIQSAYVEDHFPPESGLYNFTVYVDDGSGSVSQTKLDEVYQKLYGNDTSAYPGYVSAGINFRVLSAGLVAVAVLYTITVDAFVIGENEAETAINTAVQNYINSLWVGSDVIWTEVIRIIKSISGIEDISALTLNGSSSNIVVAASNVARVSSIGPNP